jgi:hypothetical protein
LETWNLRVCLVRIKQVHENGSTVRTHKNIDCLLKTTPTKTSKCVVNQLKHFDDMSFWEYYSGFLPKEKMCPFLWQRTCIYVDNSYEANPSISRFLMKMMSCHSIIVSLVFFLSHLSHWAWIKGYHRYLKVCLMPWLTLRRYQLVSVIYIYIHVCKYLIVMSWL